VSDIVPFQTRLTFPIDDVPPLRPGVEPVPAGAPQAAASTTLAAWELFERNLTTHDLVLAGVVPKGERLRLDAGRLGPTGLYWAAQVAGAQRVIFSRRRVATDDPAGPPSVSAPSVAPTEAPASSSAAAPAPPAASAPASAPASAAMAASALPHPHDWATWLVIGPPVSPGQLQAQP
jgi:hypothetical protein